MISGYEKNYLVTKVFVSDKYITCVGSK